MHGRKKTHKKSIKRRHRIQRTRRTQRSYRLQRNPHKRGGSVTVPGCGVLTNEEYDARVKNDTLYESCNPTA